MSRELPLLRSHRESGIETSKVWDLELPESFGDPAEEHRSASEAVALADRTYRGVIHLSGAAAAETLERITSAHAAAIDPRRGRFACILSAKGRIVGGFELFRLPESPDFRAVLLEPSRERLLQELRKYAFLSDVGVDERRDTAVLALEGPRAGEVLSPELAPRDLPAAPLEVAAARLADVPVQVIRSAETLAGGYTVWVPSEALGQVWDALLERVRKARGRAIGWRALESLRLEAGIALWGIDYDEESFPNEVGWEHALTYDKCYVGQEVVARMRTYGQINRRLFQVLLEGERVPERGARIFAGDDEAGSITSSAWSYLRRRPLALGRLRRRFWKAEALTVELGGEAGGERVPVALGELPLPAKLRGAEAT